MARTSNQEPATSNSLRSRVLIITGASSGIGAATALECARTGMDVVINGRRAERLEEVATRIRSLGGNAECVAGDVTDPDTTTRLLDTAVDRFGCFDAVFANAGYGFRQAIAEMPSPAMREIFEVNFFAGVDLLREAARRLLAAERRGHLLMCSSCLSKFTVPRFSAYSATKAAQNHVTRAMRMELAGSGIDVSSVHPITTTTEFFDVADRTTARMTDEPGAPERGLEAQALEQTPRFLVQPPERVARAVVRCLRHPRPEVWTSTPVRLLAALSTVFPRTVDALIMRQERE